MDRVYSRRMSISPSATSPFSRVTASPIGRLQIDSDGNAITALTIESAGRLPADGTSVASCSILDLAARQLAEYFSGERRTFELPITLRGTPFQLSVWNELSSLGFGQYTSYGELGELVGRPSAGRAVGGAVGSNPIPLIVPCHRVLASNQRITGYSGGEGIPTKVWLLKHEAIPFAA